MSCHIYTFRVYTDVKGARVRYKSTKPINLAVSAEVFKYVCVCVCDSWTDCVLQRKWQQSTSCSDGNLICGTSCPGCYHTQITLKLKDKYMEEQTHRDTQHRPPPSLFQFALSPEPTVNTNSLFSAQLCLGGFFFLSVCVSVCMCECSFHGPITTVLLIHTILTLWYQVKGL